VPAAKLALQLTVHAMPLGVETTVPPTLVLTTSFVTAETTVPLTGGTTTAGTPFGGATIFGVATTFGGGADSFANPSGTATGLELLEVAALLLLVAAVVPPPPPQPPSNNAEIKSVTRLRQTGRADFSQEDPAKGRISLNVKVMIGVFMFFVLLCSQNSLTAEAANNEECMRVWRSNSVRRWQRLLAQPQEPSPFEAGATSRNSLFHELILLCDNLSVGTRPYDCNLLNSVKRKKIAQRQKYAQFSEKSGPNG
jgi:hypothetical protein